MIWKQDWAKARFVFVFIFLFPAFAIGQGAAKQSTAALQSAAPRTAALPAKAAATDSASSSSTAMDVASSSQKHRVAVLNFNHSQVLSSVESLFGSEQNLGQYFADLLANRLTADNVMRIVDRNGMNRALQDPTLPERNTQADQTFRSPGSLMTQSWKAESAEQLAERESVSRVGSILGVNSVIRYFGADAIIVGDIISFGREDDRDPGVAGKLTSKVFSTCNKSRAVVTVNVRMIDLNKGELIASTNMTAISHRPSCNLLQAHGYSRPVSSIMDTTFPQTALGDAMTQASAMVAQVMESGSQQTPVLNPTQVYGKVADISGNDLTVNVGSVMGVHPGDILVVSRVTRTIKDPDSSKTIRAVEEMEGQIHITSVTPFYAVGTFTGRGTPAINDVVRNVNQ